MRAFGEPDAFPAGQLQLRRILTNGQGPPSEDDFLKLAEIWRPWRAYATVYLWTASVANSAKDESSKFPRPLASALRSKSKKEDRAIIANLIEIFRGADHSEHSILIGAIDLTEARLAQPSKLRLDCRTAIQLHPLERRRQIIFAET
jgi:hypothetical protein